MMKNFLDTVEITEQTESGIQIAKSRIIIPKVTVSAINSGIILPKSSVELMEVIADVNNKKITF